MTDVVVTSPKAQGIICPFTGKPLVVHMTVQPGSIVFSAPDAFSLAQPVSTIDELYRRASMRNGIEGIAGPESRQTDPYTGLPLRLREMPGIGFCFVGGYNPRSGCSSLEELLYKATMRDGVSKFSNPAGDSHVTVPPKNKKPPRKKPVDVSEDVAEAAEKAAAATGKFEKNTSVSFAGTK